MVVEGGGYLTFPPRSAKIRIKDKLNFIQGDVLHKANLLSVSLKVISCIRREELPHNSMSGSDRVRLSVLAEERLLAETQASVLLCPGREMLLEPLLRVIFSPSPL